MKKVWMVAAAASVALGLSAQDSGVETQGIGVVIDAHALVDVVNDEIVFDFSADDPTEAGAAFALGTVGLDAYDYAVSLFERSVWLGGVFSALLGRPADVVGVLSLGARFARARRALHAVARDTGPSLCFGAW